MLKSMIIIFIKAQLPIIFNSNINCLQNNKNKNRIIYSKNIIYKIKEK